MKLDYITFNNMKLVETGIIESEKIGTFDLPEKRTCPFKGICSNYCYAIKASQRFQKTREKRERNFQASLKEDFSLNILINIIESGATAIRIHSTGDFYSKEYLNKWIEVAKALPYIKFYCYTKSIPFFKNKKLPLNFLVVFSYGGTKDHLIRPQDRQAKVFEKEVPKGWIEGNKNDFTVYKTKKIGIKKH